jgi:hypothetical protein
MLWRSWPCGGTRGRDLPVVGAIEACAHFACILGARFGVITILDSDIPVIETNQLAARVILDFLGAIFYELGRRRAVAAGEPARM